MYDGVRRAVRSLAGLVLPQYCSVCDSRVFDDASPLICPACWDTVERIEPPLCPGCGRPHDRAVAFATEDYFLCAECRDTPLEYIDLAGSATVYDGVMKEALILFKYGRRDILAQSLAGFMISFACQRMAVGEFDRIVPVPLYSLRRRDRGFNQSEMLAAEMSRRTDGPPVVNALIKTRPTPPQAGLDADARRKNLKDAFEPAAGCNMKNGSILLIDDVLTTGSTANECARVLKESGADQVAVLTLARRV